MDPFQDTTEAIPVLAGRKVDGRQIPLSKGGTDRKGVNWKKKSDEENERITECERRDKEKGKRKIERERKREG